MKLEQIYTGCIAHAAYYLESNGEAAIFDPLREVQPYIDRANKDNAKIKYVFETHFHADFVSGHLDLAKKTGALIVYGPTAKPGFDAVVAEDNQIFKVGNYQVKALHTPGHTMESTCYLIIDENGKELLGESNFQAFETATGLFNFFEDFNNNIEWQQSNNPNQVKFRSR
jgi:glyoxylase-like metal-dependent hydrolase (beta-lactamase superfamily II)